MKRHPLQRLKFQHRSLQLLSWAVLTVFLVACGNADQGIEKKRQDLNGLGTATTVTYGPEGTGFGPCKNLTVRSGDDPSFAYVMNGTSVCPSTGYAHVVRLKAGANLPTNMNFCLIPVTPTAALMETCFRINGQEDIALSSSTFSAVILVRESDVADYRAYFSYQTNVHPPLGHAALP